MIYDTGTTSAYIYAPNAMGPMAAIKAESSHHVNVPYHGSWDYDLVEYSVNSRGNQE